MKNSGRCHKPVQRGSQSADTHTQAIRNAGMNVLIIYATLTCPWEGLEVGRSGREQDLTVPLGDKCPLCGQELLPILFSSTFRVVKTRIRWPKGVLEVI